ncbi:hypothetical protein B0H10DRAFT_357329 [Mycena sp. CBHHK59/15]|nr:hypothetical protein B0H10DRAFT_357329 [Mycena sp. CBHHK59/15]
MSPSIEAKKIVKLIFIPPFLFLVFAVILPLSNLEKTKCMLINWRTYTYTCLKLGCISVRNIPDPCNAVEVLHCSGQGSKFLLHGIPEYAVCTITPPSLVPEISVCALASFSPHWCDLDETRTHILNAVLVEDIPMVLVERVKMRNLPAERGVQWAMQSAAHENPLQGGMYRIWA